MNTTWNTVCTEACVIFEVAQTTLRAGKLLAESSSVLRALALSPQQGGIKNGQRKRHETDEQPINIGFGKDQRENLQPSKKDSDGTEHRSQLQQCLTSRRAALCLVVRFTHLVNLKARAGRQQLGLTGIGDPATRTFNDSSANRE